MNAMVYLKSTRSKLRGTEERDLAYTKVQQAMVPNPTGSFDWVHSSVCLLTCFCKTFTSGIHIYHVSVGAV